LRASGREASANLPFKVTNDTLEISLVEDRFLLGGAEEKRSATEIVDPAGHTLGVIVDQSDEAIAEERIVTASDAEVVLDVGGGLLEVEGVEVVADGDALVEGLEGGEAEFVGQLRLAEEDEGEQGGGVHVVVEEKAELIEDIVGEEMGLIDDEEDGAALASQIGEGSVELREETGEAEGGLDLEGE
jgi:hypothetical protein